MDDEFLREMSRLVVSNAIQKAIDQVKAERGEFEDNLDQGIEDIVGLTIGRSLTAVREGQVSPTDGKMEGLIGRHNSLANLVEASNVSGLGSETTGQCKTNIQKAIDQVQTEREQFEDNLDQGIEDIVGLTIGRSITAVREGQVSPTDGKMEGLLGRHNSLANKEKSEVANAQTGRETGNDHQGHEVNANLGKTHVEASNVSGLGSATTCQCKTNLKGKKNVFERLLDKVLKRDQKHAKECNNTTGGSNITPSDGNKKRSSKAHNKRDWIRKHLLCCFVRQTSTVHPEVD